MNMPPTSRICEECERLTLENDQLRDAVTIWQKLADERKEQIAAQSDLLTARSETQPSMAEIVAAGGVIDGANITIRSAERATVRFTDGSRVVDGVMQPPQFDAPASSVRRSESGESFIGESFIGENDYREALLHFTSLRTDAQGFVHDFSLACGIADAMLDGKKPTLSATSLSNDEARLLWLDTLLRHCPHAELTYNDDEDDGPVGFRLVVESCTRLDLQAPTLDALIDLGINTIPDEDGDVVARTDRCGP